MQVLSAHFDANQELKGIIEEIKSCGFVSDAAAQKLAREAVTKLIELNG